MKSIRKQALCVGGLIVFVTALAGCGPKAPVKSTPPPPPPAALIIPSKPAPPMGASIHYNVPGLTTTGARQTVNFNISPAQTTWNLRSAYNVAALNCLQPQHADILVGYKAYLKKHSRALTAANAGVDRDFKAKHGAAFIRPREAYMTAVYNFYAFPPTNQGFCDAALAMSREVQGIAVGTLDSFSQRALPQLDAVFENFNLAYEQYRVDLAGWEAKYQPTVANQVTPPSTPPVVPPR